MAASYQCKKKLNLLRDFDIFVSKQDILEIDKTQPIKMGNSRSTAALGVRRKLQLRGCSIVL